MFENRIQSKGHKIGTYIIIKKKVYCLAFLMTKYLAKRMDTMD